MKFRDLFEVDLMPHHIAYTDPLRAGRHPFQTYLLALCLLSGAPLLVGKAPAESVEASVPVWLAAAWGLMLFGGAAVALIGSYWRGGYANALTLERIGLSTAGAPALVYAVLLVSISGVSKLTAALILAGFGLSCLRRSRDIGRIIRRASAPASETATVDKESD